MENNPDFVIKHGVLTKYNGPGGEVVIPEGVTKIEAFAFQGCTGLTSVTIPAGVKKIEATAFSQCAGLTEILADANNSVYHSVDGMLLEKDCLFTCPAGKTGSVTIPEGVMKIKKFSFGDGAFEDCMGLTSVTIPAGVTKVWATAFSKCTGLTEILTDPNNSVVQA